MMTMNDIWREVKDNKQQTDIAFWKLRWYLRGILGFSAVSAILLAALFGGLL